MHPTIITRLTIGCDVTNDHHSLEKEIDETILSKKINCKNQQSQTVLWPTIKSGNETATDRNSEILIPVMDSSGRPPLERAIRLFSCNNHKLSNRAFNRRHCRELLLRLSRTSTMETKITSLQRNEKMTAASRSLSKTSLVPVQLTRVTTNLDEPMHYRWTTQLSEPYA